MSIELVGIDLASWIPGLIVDGGPLISGCEGGD